MDAAELDRLIATAVAKAVAPLPVRIAELEAEVAQPKEENADLKGRLALNSRNSGKP